MMPSVAVCVSMPCWCLTVPGAAGAPRGGARTEGNCLESGVDFAHKSTHRAALRFGACSFLQPMDCDVKSTDCAGLVDAVSGADADIELAHTVLRQLAILWDGDINGPKLGYLHDLHAGTTSSCWHRFIKPQICDLSSSRKYAIYRDLSYAIYRRQQRPSIVHTI